MTPLLPLPLWPFPVTDTDLAALKRAKAALSLPFNVLPCQAAPGSPTRVLALRTTPDFLCDYALIRDPENEAAVLAAMTWALDPTVDDPRATLVIDGLRSIFGPEVNEVECVD